MRQDRRTPHWRALLWGLPLFGALLAVAGTLSVPRIEDDLRAKVRASLAQAGFTELNVDMSGRDALIASADNYPVGATETVRELTVQWGVRKADVALIESASASGPSAPSLPAGAGTDGGAAAVRPRVGVPVIFAEIENGKLTLRGSYAQESQHDRLLAAATSAYGAANVTDQLSAAAQGEEAPTDDGIAALATALAATAEDFVAGQVGFGVGRLTMEGTAADAAGRDRLLDVLKATERKGVPVKSTLSLARGSTGPTTTTPSTTTAKSPTATASSAGAANDAVAQLNRLVTLKPVLFQPATAEILSESLPTLQSAADILGPLLGVTVTVEGHTDSIGPEPLNQQLSEERASAVRASLVRLGVPEARLNAVGYGESRPIASNDSEAGRQANRRVQFSVKS